MATNSEQDTLLQGLDDLLIPFHEACKPRSQFRIGTEAEKFGVLMPTGAPLPFEGERGVKRVLTELQQRFGWQPESEYEHGDVIALRRDNASITLEPGGQLELSGAPVETTHHTCREFRRHMAELREICDPLGIVWLSLGFHPFARIDELPRVPKLRYGLMERYLPTRAPRALDMMFRTCTVQANLDYSDEADAMRKLRVSLALQPIVTAMFANSPCYEGRLSEREDERADVWLHMDPDRTGLLPFAWEREMSFRRYVEWALDAPMFLIKRGARIVPNTHQTFRTFLREGSGGERATLSDWKTHINSLFPEVRLKNTLEMRGADAQPTDLTCALPSLWKGILYDDRAMAQAERLIEPLNPQNLQAARAEIARSALAAKLLGRTVHSWASEVLEIARSGLDRQAQKNERGESESVHLSRLNGLVAEGRSPANVLRSRVHAAANFHSGVIEASRI
ncbi:MAG TPA: glutamate-cysteine ligase family protein [Polyangiales bacterium]|nr:glutamate-cysteine ligase family protein [Polyangiales bacterium]